MLLQVELQRRRVVPVLACRKLIGQREHNAMVCGESLRTRLKIEISI